MKRPRSYARLIVAVIATMACLPPGHDGFWPSSSDAHHDALAPTSRDVRPVRVVSTSGQVKNAGALTGQAKGTTTLTRSANGPDPVVLLDYGRNVEGFPYFNVSGGTGDPTLSAAYSEVQAYLTPKGDIQILSGSFGGDLHRYNTFSIKGPGVLRNKRIQGAQRFQQIRLTTPGTVELSAAGIDFSAPLASPDQGFFVSSSDVLNRIWDSSVYTARLDSLPADSEPGKKTPPLLVDGPKRDRNVWSGDLLTPGQTVYYSTGASQHIQGSLDLLGRTQKPSGEISAHATGDKSDCWSEAYSMSWVAALAEYYRFTGDTRFVRDHWPEARREMAWNASHVDRRGLLITNGKTWHPVDGQDFHGAVTSDNALYFHILDGAAEVASDLGYTDEAAGYRARAADLKTAINRSLFDRTTGDYAISDKRPGQTAQDGDALAVLYGIAPADRVDGILRALRSRLWTPKGPRAFSVDSGLLGAYSQTGELVPAISPFASSLELWARLSADDTNGGLSLLRTLWGPMADPAGDFYTGTVWEVLNPDGEPGLSAATSLSHAWGTGAAAGLSAYVLGVRPTSAGFGTWTVEPQPGDLKWAQGRTPTPHGDITVKWGRRDGAFALEAGAPAGTSGTVVVPRPDRGKVTVRVNGHVAWDGDSFHSGAGVDSARQDADHVYLGATGGHTLRIDASR